MLKRLSVDSTMTRPIGSPQPITELGTWEAGLLEGIVGATAEGARAEASSWRLSLRRLGSR